VADDDGDGERRPGVTECRGHVLAHDFLIVGIRGERAKEHEKQVQSGLCDGEEHHGDAERSDVVSV